MDGECPLRVTSRPDGIEALHPLSTQILGVGIGRTWTPPLGGPYRASRPLCLRGSITTRELGGGRSLKITMSLLARKFRMRAAQSKRR
jgi:hypothetical protein